MSESLGRHDIRFHPSSTGTGRRRAWRFGVVLFAASALSGCASLQEIGAGSLRGGAEAAYGAGDYERAAKLYAELVEVPGAVARDWYRLGNAYAETGRLVDAAAAYRQALSLDPKLGEARHNLGLVYLQLGVQSVLEARRGLPPVDAEAAATMRYLACIMETFMGKPEPVTCEDPAAR